MLLMLSLWLLGLDNVVVARYLDGAVVVARYLDGAVVARYLDGAVVVARYLDEALNSVSFDDDKPSHQMKLDKLLSYSLASELQCLRSASVSFCL